MRSSKRLFPAYALLALAAVMPVPGARAEDEAAAKKHDITLHRPVVVGQVMRTKAEGSLEVTSTPIFGGQRQAPQNMLTYVTLEADTEVLAIDEKGRPTRVAYTVSKCERTSDKRTIVIARKGSKIVAEQRDGKTHFTRDGKALRPEAAEALRIVARFEDGDMTHDEMAGSDVPRAIGETWDIDVDAVLKDIKKTSGDVLDPAAIGGKVSFGGIMTHEGRPCLLIETEVSVRDWLSELTPGFELESGEFSAVLQNLFPVDATLPALAESSKVTISAHLVSTPQPGQPSLEFVFEAVQRVERDVTPISAPSSVATAQEDASSADPN